MRERAGLAATLRSSPVGLHNIRCCQCHRREYDNQNRDRFLSPSLYRYFRRKNALLQAVNLLTLQQLFAEIDGALQANTGGPAERLLAVAQTLRGFAHAHPHTYVSTMTAQVSVTRPDEDLLVQMALPIQAVMAQISGPDRSLSALRGLLALAHGFSMLELHNQLQRGGDLDAAFADFVVADLNGWPSP